MPILVKSWLLVCWCLFFGTFCSSELQARSHVLRNLSCKSSVLNREVQYHIMLPDGYDSGNFCYPVVFLLHGFNGNRNNWLDEGNIQKSIDSLEQAGTIQPRIYVLPDGYNSYYINNYNQRMRYADFFLNEFVPAIDSAYRICSGASQHALMGLSMGGYGSIILALLAPDKFGTVVALSPAVRTREQYDQLSQASYDTHFREVFGPVKPNETRITEHWLFYSPYFRLKPPASVAYRQLNWNILCGQSDTLLSSSEAFSELLSKNGIAHTFISDPGGHTWVYWRKAAAQGLQLIEFHTGGSGKK